jgi:hypothetical protein
MVFAIATSPGSSKRTSTTYRSAGAMTTDGTHCSRSYRPMSDATIFARAFPNVTLKVRVLATFVRKKRTTSPRPDREAVVGLAVHHHDVAEAPHEGVGRGAVAPGNRALPVHEDVVEDEDLLAVAGP